MAGEEVVHRKIQWPQRYGLEGSPRCGFFVRHGCPRSGSPTQDWEAREDEQYRCLDVLHDETLWDIWRIAVGRQPR